MATCRIASSNTTTYGPVGSLPQSFQYVPAVVKNVTDVPLPKVALDGKSLLPIIRSADTPTHHKVMHWQWQKNWAVREGDWKLIGSGAKGRQLVSLADEEPERQNHIEEHPEIAERLNKLHAEWARDVMPAPKE